MCGVFGVDEIEQCFTVSIIRLEKYTIWNRCLILWPSFQVFQTTWQLKRHDFCHFCNNYLLLWLLYFKNPNWENSDFCVRKGKNNISKPARRATNNLVTQSHTRTQTVHCHNTWKRLEACAGCTASGMCFIPAAYKTAHPHFIHTPQSPGLTCGGLLMNTQYKAACRPKCFACDICNNIAVVTTRSATYVHITEIKMFHAKIPQ